MKILSFCFLFFPFFTMAPVTAVCCSSSAPFHPCFCVCIFYFSLVQFLCINCCSILVVVLLIVTMRTYSCEELLCVKHRAGTPPVWTPEELWRGICRGKKTDAKVRERTETDGRFKPFLLSNIMGSVRSLANKSDELGALVNIQCEYPECSLMCLTETRLNGNVPAVLSSRLCADPH